MPLVAAASLLWQLLRPGLWLEERAMAPRGALATVKAVALKLEPERFRLELVSETRDQGTRGAWTVERAPAEAVAAFNAGQFEGGWPWGWLVRDGHEQQPPGRGALAMAFLVDSSGAASLVTQDELAAVRGRASHAFQSYPALLTGRAELPWELRASGRGADLEHRDSRLALGVLADGKVVVVLTRFTGLGPAGEQLPYGPTVPEMAAFMRRLGCTRAMLLDGGMSSQMLVRASGGTQRVWKNWRPVPLGLVIRGRSAP